MKNVHPCDFKPIQHILSVHSNVTAVTTMCFIGGIAFMTVVDWGNALFVPLGHLLDHPIFIIIAIIIKGHFPHHTCYYAGVIIFGSSKTSLAHLLNFIAISIAIPFLYRLEKLRGRGISGHWRIVSHCPTLFHHLSSFGQPQPPIFLPPGIYNQTLTVFDKHKHTSYCTIQQISPS